MKVKIDFVGVLGFAEIFLTEKGAAGQISLKNSVLPSPASGNF